MRHSRSPYSLSTSSSKSYPSEGTRHRSFSSRHSNSSKSRSRKVKFIIAIGIALPIVAAVIGVVAWAVSADNAFEGTVAHSLRRSDSQTGNHEEDIFQALEDRHDIEYSRHFAEPNHNIHNRVFSRLDVDQKLDNHEQFDDSVHKDPLYIVHFVPTAKPNVEPSTAEPSSVSTVSNEVLQKILSASKGAKPGTPQFVVFAPIPGEEAGTDEVGTLKIGSQGVNEFLDQSSSNDELDHHRLDELSNQHPPNGDIDHQRLNQLVNQIPPKGEMDYDYEEELRKYQQLLDSNKETSRVGHSRGISETKSQKKSVKEVKFQNLTSENVYKPSPSFNNLQTNNFNPQELLALQQNYQQNTQGHPPVYQQSSPHNYIQQPSQHVQQTVQPYVQQQYTPQQESYSNQPVHPQAQATDRSGQYEPIGIKLNIGGGNGKGLLDGGYSPLGIIGSILRPLLPRRILPQVNLNGKVMFGVMLEKGVKLGDRGHNYG